LHIRQKNLNHCTGCTQGGVLSPLLWSLVIDKNLIDFNSQGYEVFGFADDIVIMVSCKVD
jgi:Reverse transcriptase (RNA-dependent DNA polymerase)